MCERGMRGVMGREKEMRERGERKRGVGFIRMIENLINK